MSNAFGKVIALYSESTPTGQSTQADWEYYVHGMEREARLDPVEGVDYTPGKFDTSEVSFFLYDHLGNTRMTYTPKYRPGTSLIQVEINAVMDYYPYGKILREYVNGQEERYLTTQHERDKETGLDYRGARYYDSDIGRFLSLDPAAKEYPSLSDYCYVANNPILLIDPDGRKIKWGKYSEVKDNENQFGSRKEYNKAKRELKNDIKNLRKESGTFNEMYKDLDDSDRVYKMFANASSGGNTVVGDNETTITMGLGAGEDYNAGTFDRETSIMTTAAHEFGHAWRSEKGFDSHVTLDHNMTYFSATLINNARRTEMQMETDAVHIENIVRAELMNGGRNLDFKREYHGIFVKAEQLSTGRYKAVYRGGVITDMVPSGGESKYLSGEYTLKNITK